VLDVPPGDHLIDHKSNIPYYVQLTQVIREKIQQKSWGPGSKIPGEMELCDEVGVSRTVVRQALRELELSGLIMRRKGKGTFVAEPKINESLVQKLTGSYQDMAERGLQSSTQVLHHRVVPCTEKVATYLQVSPGTMVVDINRLRFVENSPIQLVNTYVPLDLCPALADVDLTNRSLYEFLEHECGLWISRGRRYVEAVAANDIQAKLLEIDRGAPLIALDSISYLESGRPVEYYHAVHRGDRSRFEVELLRSRGQTQEIDPTQVDVDSLPHSDATVSK
jgi:DNA-binding GntR family transcriptional regulator